MLRMEPGFIWAAYRVARPEGVPRVRRVRLPEALLAESSLLVDRNLDRNR